MIDVDRGETQRPSGWRLGEPAEIGRDDRGDLRIAAGRTPVRQQDQRLAAAGNLDLAVDDYLAHNINYLRNILGVKLPPF